MRTCFYFWPQALERWKQEGLDERFSGTVTTEEGEYNPFHFDPSLSLGTAKNLCFSLLNEADPASRLRPVLESEASGFLSPCGVQVISRDVGQSRGYPQGGSYERCQINQLQHPNLRSYRRSDCAQPLTGHSQCRLLTQGFFSGSPY